MGNFQCRLEVDFSAMFGKRIKTTLKRTSFFSPQSKKQLQNLGRTEISRLVGEQSGRRKHSFMN